MIQWKQDFIPYFIVNWQIEHAFKKAILHRMVEGAGWGSSIVIAIPSYSYMVSYFQCSVKKQGKNLYNQGWSMMLYVAQWCEFSNLGDLGSWKAAGVLLSVSVPLLVEHYADLWLLLSYHHITHSHVMMDSRSNATHVLCCVLISAHHTVCQWWLYQWQVLASVVKSFLYTYSSHLLLVYAYIIPSSAAQQSEKLIRIKN